MKASTKAEIRGSLFQVCFVLPVDGAAFSGMAPAAHVHSQQISETLQWSTEGWKEFDFFSSDTKEKGFG